MVRARRAAGGSPPAPAAPRRRGRAARRRRSILPQVDARDVQQVVDQPRRAARPAARSPRAPRPGGRPRAAAARMISSAVQIGASGLRSSWPSIARNSSLRWSASSARARASRSASCSRAFSIASAARSARSSSKRAIVVGERVVLVVARGGDRAQRPPARLERERRAGCGREALRSAGRPKARSAPPYLAARPRRSAPRSRWRAPCPTDLPRAACGASRPPRAGASADRDPGRGSPRPPATRRRARRGRWSTNRPTWASTWRPSAFRTEATSRLAAAKTRDASASTRRRAVDRRSRSARSARCSACAHWSATTRRKATFGASNAGACPKESPRAPMHTSSATSGTAAQELAGERARRGGQLRVSPDQLLPRAHQHRLPGTNRVGHRQVGRQREAGPRSGRPRLVTAGVRDLQRRAVWPIAGKRRPHPRRAPPGPARRPRWAMDAGSTTPDSSVARRCSRSVHWTGQRFSGPIVSFIAATPP